MPPTTSALGELPTVLQATGASSLILLLDEPSPGEPGQLICLGDPLPPEIAPAILRTQRAPSYPELVPGAVPLWLQTIPIAEDGRQPGAVVLAYAQRSKPIFSPNFLRLVSALVACVWRNGGLHMRIAELQRQIASATPPLPASEGVSNSGAGPERLGQKDPGTIVPSSSPETAVR